MRHQSPFHILTAALAVSLFPVISAAHTIRVRQDGSGDFLTVSQGVAAAVANDSISVGPGTYVQGTTLSLSFALTIFSTNGPDVTQLSGASTQRILSSTAPNVKLQGLTFVNGQGQGSPSGAGALYLLSGSKTVVENCVFRGNKADWGGAIYCTDSTLGNGTSLDMLDCVFDTNTGFGTAGAAYIVNGALGNSTRCTFRNNTGGNKAGAVHVIRSTGNFESCLFQGNRSGDVAGAIFLESSTGSVRSCTFFDHTSPGDIAGTIVAQLSPNTTITRNIFDGDTAGYGLRYLSAVGQHACNVYWNNAAGAVGADVLGVDEVIADPLFCDPGAGDFTVSTTSVAAPANNACNQLIGKFPAACTLAPAGVPQILTIADIPQDNGGKVRIRWQRSSYDAREQPFSITQYGIYRRQPADGAATAPPATALKAGRNPGVDLDGWDFVATVPARGDAIYQFVAPTLCDTPQGGPPCLSSFFISAMTPNPLDYFDSEPASGESVDNLAPAAPQGLAGRLVTVGVIELRWERNTEPDLAYYAIYRSTDPSVAIVAANRIGTTTTPTFTDPDFGPAMLYRVTAVDQHGNESAAPPSATPVEMSTLVTALQTVSEPGAGGPVEIRYSIADATTPVRLEVFDVVGHRVVSLYQGSRAPGLYTAEWQRRDQDGTRVARGVYIVRFQAGALKASRKIAVVRE